MTLIPRVLILLLLVLIVQSPAVAIDDDPAVIRLFRIEGTYQDHNSGAGLDPMALLTGGVGPTRNFLALVNKIDEVSGDDEIDAVAFDLSGGFSMNGAQLGEFSRCLDRLAASGKHTFTWMESADTSSLVIASACDSVVLAEFGGVDITSPAMNSIHFKTAMDLFGVEASVARAGDFKGAVEPYTRPEMSSHLREHYQAMLTAMNHFIVARISSGRDLEPGVVRQLQKTRMFTARQALEAGLVDVLAPYGSFERTVEGLIPGVVKWKRPSKAKAKAVNPFQIFTEIFSPKKKKKVSEPTIAVLHLAGEIIDGNKPSPGSMVSGPSAAEIRRLAKDDNVKGVVVRVDSPGGSATASEVIRIALEELAEEKPIVYSMGRLAASGGYWITCVGRPIIAEESTITGSIGVFGMKLSFGPAMRRFGINMTPVVLDEAAAMMSPEHAWTDQEVNRIQGYVMEVYEEFLERVAGSREMSRDAVAAIAGGRVWAGSQAVELGLVDGIGGIDSALAMIRDAAGLPDDAPVIHTPQAPNPFDILEMLAGNEDEAIRALADLPALRLLAAAGIDLTPYLTWALEATRGTGFKVMARQEIDIDLR